MLLTTKRMVKTTVLGIGLLLTGSTFAQTSDLLISEYVEGSSNNKYIEIFNGTSAPIDLSNYQIRLYSNGNSSPNVVNTLSGFLGDSDVAVYSNSQASIYGGNQINLGSMSFNGDDAIELYNTSTGMSVDIFGVIGCDPGSQWISASNRTQNRTLRRNDDVLSGVTTNPSCTPAITDFATLESEWTEYPTDNIDDLGLHFVVAGGNDCAADLFFSEYIEGSSLNKCLEITNNTGAAIDLAAGGYQVQIFFNGNTNAGTTISLTGILANDDVYVICDDGADAAFLAEADLTPTNSFYNGDDAIVLSNSAGTIDIIGEIGNDPGSSWSSASASTANNTLVRKSFVTQGISTNPAGSGFATLDTEWTSLGNNVSDSLGAHYIACGAVAPPVVDLGADLVVCEGTSITLDAGPNGVTYLWSTGETTQTITVSQAGVYSVDVTNTGGSDSDAVTVNIINDASVAIAGNTNLCEGGSTDLTAELILDELIFSEYVEGSSFNKCIEIYNGTGADVDLSTYALDVVFNGGSSTTTLALSGTVANGDVYVLCDDGAVAAFLAEADAIVTNSLWNGDDAIVLTNGGNTVDIFGVIGNDPGSQWVSTSNSTANQTLVRNANITSGITANSSETGSSAFGTLETQWTALPSNDASSIGSHNIVGDYVWSTGDVTQTITVSPTNFNAYSVDVTYGNGCSASGSTTVSVESISAQVSGASAICEGESIQLCGEVTTNELFFSEYVEGSSLNKCIEIFNGTGNDVDLAAEGYTLDISFNGGSGTASIALTGTIANGGTYVLCDDGAASAFLASADQTTTNSLWNGDDALTLSKSGVAVDIFGVIGNDPGSQWTSASNSTANTTLRRSGNVTQGITTNPSSDFDALESQWTASANNDASGLGTHALTLGGSITWSTGETTDCIIVSPSTTTDYTYTYTSQNGCTADYTATVVVNQNPDVDAGGCEVVYFGYAPEECADLTATSSSVVTYSWDNAVTGASQTVCPQMTTDYTVTAANANGCTAQSTVTVNVVDVRCGKKNDKVLICKVPPGNPSNTHQICVSPNAVPAHLATGSYLGPCGQTDPCTGTAKSNFNATNEIVFGSTFDVTVYPSPLVSGDVLNIAIKGIDGEATVQVFSLSGQNLGLMTVHSSDAIEQVVEFSTAGLNDGIYLCKVLSETGEVSTKRFTVLR